MLGEPRRAAFFARLGAGLIDWLIVFAGLWLAVIVEAILAPDTGGVALALSYTAILVLPMLYFGLSWAGSGQTLGLRTTELQLVSTRTWKPPSRPRALLRALVAVLTFVALWVPLVAAFADASTAQLAAIIGVAVAFVLLALIGHLWAFVDPRGQSLQDRLFGLAVVPTRPDPS